MPSQADAEERGAACYRAGITIDELATAIYDLARASGTHVWSWIMAGYYDARATAIREQVERLGMLRDQLLREPVSRTAWLMFAANCDDVTSEQTAAWAIDARVRAACAA